VHRRASYDPCQFGLVVTLEPQDTTKFEEAAPLNCTQRDEGCSWGFRYRLAAISNSQLTKLSNSRFAGGVN
jgi:hypothetical protein